MTDSNPNEPIDDLAARAFTAIGTPDNPEDVEGQDAAPEAPALTSAQLIGGALAAGREVFCMVTHLESPKRVLTDERAQELGALWGPVCEKHGIDLAKYLGDYAVEVAAVVGTFVIGLELRRAVTAEIIAKRPATASEAAPQAHGDTINI